MPRAFRLAGLLFGLFSGFAIAQSNPPEQALGLSWLQAQVRSDGTLADETTSIALPLQARAETALTLTRFGVAAGAVADAVASDTQALAEFAARRALVAAAANRPASSAVLATLRNGDGGFAPSAGYASNVLDTAFALQAYAAAASNDAQSVSAALAYLQSARLTDGGWGVGPQSSVYVTAQVLLAAQAWSSRYAVGTIAAPARDWLLGARSAQQFGNVTDNAHGLLALATQTSDAAVIGPLADALKSAQRTDGSWAGDSYQTALALRALWFVTHTPPAPTTGEVGGKVADQSTGLPLQGVTVQLASDTSIASASAADGGFTLAGIAAGTATVRLSLLGYETRDIGVQVTAGQSINLGTVTLKPAPLTASLFGVVKDSNGTVMRDVIVSVGTASVLTDANGAYELTGLNPGTAEITAAKTNYRTATATAAFEAGKRYAFSPTLYPSSVTPPTTATLRGLLVDASNGQALAGVTVAVGTAMATTATNGRFDIANLAAGAFAMSASKVGYQTLRANGTLVVGVNDVGTLRLERTPATSTISGVVTDADTHAAVAGAMLVVQGQSATATSGPDGKYALGGVQGTSFTLLVSAPGYLNRSLAVTLPQPGAGALDVELTAVQASGIVFDEVRTNRPVYGPSEEIELEIEVKNTTTSDAELVVDAEVRDPQGNVVYVFKANRQGLGQNPPNLPLSFAAGSTTEVEMDWVTLRQLAGVYTVAARGTDTSGRVLAEGTTHFTIDAKPVLRGAVTPNPPLVQAGTDTPVHITTDLTNVGNETVPAGDLELTITLENPDTQTSTQPLTTAKQLFLGVPLTAPRGLVRDAAGNLYTVNNSDGKVIKTDPTGATTVFATLPINNATHDLALDPGGGLWAASGNTKLYRVSAAGAVSGVTLTTISLLSALDTTDNGDVILLGRFIGTSNGVSVDEQRLVLRTAQGTESVLWRNGLSQPIALVKDDAGNWIVSNYGDNSLAKVAVATGAIVPFASGLNRPKGIARDVSGNVFVANSGDNSIVRVAPDGSKSVYATGFNQPADVRFAADGTLFVSAQGEDAIYKVQSDGTASLFAKGVVYQPEGMKYDAAGNLYIANVDGTLRRLGTDDRVTVLSTSLHTPKGMDFAPNGDLLIANYSDGTVGRVAAGATSVFTAGLRNPYGVAVDGQGGVNVTEYGTNRISRFDASGAALGTVETLLENPSSIVVDGANRLFVRNANFVTVIESGGPRVLARVALSALAPDPVNGGIVGLRGTDVVRIALDGTVTKLKTLAFTAYDVAVDANGDLLLRDYYGKKLHKLDAAGNVTVLATLADYPWRLVADAAGNVIVRLNGGAMYHVAIDGTLTEIAYALNEYMNGMTLGADGKLLAWTNYSRLQQIDPATGTVTKLKDSFNPTDVTRDAAGNLVALYQSEQQIQFHSGVAAVSSKLDGFMSPRDIVWTGSELRFVDVGGRFYGYAPGGYPTRLGNFNVNYLARRGNDVVGAVNSTLYRWNGTTSQALRSVSGTSFNGVAARADGSVAAGDMSRSRLLVFDAANTVARDYAGLIRPQGLAVDGQGGLIVANNGSGTLVRLDASGKVATTFVSTLSSPRYLAFAPDGSLWVTRASGVDKVLPNGTVSSVSESVDLQGVAFDGNASFALDQSNAQLRKLDAAGWSVFAAGLSDARAVRAGGNGEFFVANRGNGTLVRFGNGSVNTLASGLSGLNVFDRGSDGRFYVGRDSGGLTQIDTDGSVHEMRVANLVGSMPFYGIADAGNGVLYGVNDGYNYGTGRYEQAIQKITVTQASAPPPAGTRVYHTTQTMGAIPVGEDFAAIDFGNWLPPYGGDFKVEVKRSDVEGTATNFIHVGPFARSELVAGKSIVPPGDQTVPMCLKLSGADFTSISRVEVSQVRRLTSIGRPYGMAGDKAGNIYFTDANKLYRTSIQGQTSTLTTGMNLAFGLAADSNENFYVADKDPANSHFRLLKIDLAGNKSVLAADLGVTSAAGVAVNSNDEVLVGAPAKLLKVTQDGTVSIVSTRGINSPRGITIDGRDNVYVQNEGNFVSMIKADGSVFDLLSKADGKEEPIFEGDGYPNITADCAENLYIATSQWQKIGQSGEEHTLAQIVARTGQVGLLFDTTKINPTLNDIDYLAFDRFGNRLLMWNDYEAMIWQAPVTCGAIGVKAHLLAQPGQTFTGMSKTPAAVIPQADGRTEYVWSLRDVTAQGDSICFDAPLKNLQLGERRQTIDSGFVSFQNSFSPDEVKVPVAVPFVQVGGLVSIAVTTDKPEYAANGTAQIGTHLENPNPDAVTGQLTVSVFDAQGQLVGNVTQQEATLAAGAALDVPGTFAIGTILPARYTVRAEIEADGRVQARAETSFVVLPDNAAASAVSSVSTDRQAYAPTDRVLIASRARNQSANVILENLTLMVRVLDASNQQQYSVGHAINQLLPGGLRDFSATQTLRNAAPGHYRVVQQLLDSEGHMLDVREVGYDVQSTSDSGVGITGTITATPDHLLVGQVSQLDASISNAGNSNVTALPVHLSVVDLDHEQVVWHWDGRVDVAQGGSVPLIQTWTASGVALGNYVAVLTATVGGQEHVLAQHPIVVTAQSVDVAVSQSLQADNRVLALVTCRDTQGRDDPGCTESRAAFLDQYLDALGVEHKIVTTTAAFQNEFRSGRYNTYWISGGAEKLANTLAEEVREAVYRGDGLLVEGNHDSRNGILDEALGVKHRGQLPRNDHAVAIPAGGLYPAAIMAAKGDALRLDAVTAHVEARFDSAQGDAAAFSNTYGNGRAVAFGFDLLGSLQAGTDTATWRSVVNNGLIFVVPVPSADVPAGSYVPLTTVVQNRGPAVEVVVRIDAPAGVTIETAMPNATSISPSSVSWRIALAAGETRVLDVGLRVSGASAAYTIATQVGYVSAGNVTPIQSLSFVLNVRSLADTAAAATVALQALSPTSPSERNARDNAVAMLQRALDERAANQYEAAIADLLKARDRLLSIASVDVSPAHRALTQLLGVFEVQSLPR